MRPEKRRTPPVLLQYVLGGLAVKTEVIDEALRYFRKLCFLYSRNMAYGIFLKAVLINGQAAELVADGGCEQYHRQADYK